MSKTHFFWTEGNDRVTDNGRRTAAAAKMGGDGGGGQQEGGIYEM